MGTQKWYIVEHSQVAIRNIMRIQFLHRGLHGCSGKIFRSLFANGSHQRRSAMDEAVSSFNEKSHNSCLSRIKEELGTRQKQCKVYAMTQGSGMMVLSGAKSALGDLDSLLSLLPRQRKPQSS